MIWERVAGLELVVEGYALERLEALERITSVFVLAGAGTTGASEDILPAVEHHDALRDAGPYLELAGAWTLAGFCDHLATLDQWRPQAPEWDVARNWRNWALEAAGLDLALRQAGVSLGEALGIEPRPVRFVNSLGLGDPPSVEKIARRVALNPTVGFKLDAEVSWTPEIVRGLAGLDRVETVDFKGRYGFEVTDVEALAALYRAVLDAFPAAILEDPHDLPEIDALLAPVRDRVAFDATILRASDIGDTRTINVKPSRIGGLRPLFEVYEWCAQHGVAMYGGGMGELGIARGQVELLAALFHPDAPNDVAPSPFNAPELAAGLPASPLVPSGVPGFRWA